MKNLKRAEFAVISLTLLCLAFTAGFFIGRSTSGGVVTIENVKQADVVISGNPVSGAAADNVSDEPVFQSTAVSSFEVDADTSDKASPTSAGETPATHDHNNNVTEKVNINTASAAELDGLPGIGEVLTGRIIEYRKENGGFKSIGEIMDVSGIGEKKYSDLRDMITVG